MDQTNHQDKKFHIALFPDAGEPEIRSFLTLQGLADFIRKLPVSTRGVPFTGERIYVTRGPFRYLVHGDVNIPLFDPPKLGKLDAGFGLGQGDDKSGSGEDPLYTSLVNELDLANPTPQLDEEEEEEEPPM